MFIESYSRSSTSEHPSNDRSPSLSFAALILALSDRLTGVIDKVFEAAARLAPLGAVITIPPNATRVFERLGFDVEEACRPLRYEGVSGFGVLRLWRHICRTRQIYRRRSFETDECCFVRRASHTRAREKS